MSKLIDLENMTAGDKHFLEHRNYSFFVGEKQKRKTEYYAKQAKARRKAEELLEEIQLSKEFEL